MLWVAVIVGLAAMAAIAAIALLAKQTKDDYEAAGQLVPGVASSAPPSWAGSHDPEARLHRRLRDALAALRANQAFDHSGHLLDLRVELEHQAVQVDEQLVATAALPLHLRGEPLDRLTEAVTSIERAVADLAGASAAEVSARLARVLDDVRERTGAVAQARKALDELDAEHRGSLPPASDPGPASATDPAVDLGDDSGSTDTTQPRPGP